MESRGAYLQKLLVGRFLHPSQHAIWGEWPGHCFPGLSEDEKGRYRGPVWGHAVSIFQWPRSNLSCCQGSSQEYTLNNVSSTLWATCHLFLRTHHSIVVIPLWLRRQHGLPKFTQLREAARTGSPKAVGLLSSELPRETLASVSKPNISSMFTRSRASFFRKHGLGVIKTTFNQNHPKACFTGLALSPGTQMRTVDLVGFSVDLVGFSAHFFFPEIRNNKFVTGLLTPWPFGTEKQKEKTLALNASYSEMARDLTLGQFPSETKIFAWSDSPKDCEEKVFLSPFAHKSKWESGLLK